MSRKRMIAIMRLKRGDYTDPGLICGAKSDGIVCRRYRTMETAVNRLQKEAKGYLDSLRGIAICLLLVYWFDQDANGG